jgi:pilus assembly protein CpaC
MNTKRHGLTALFAAWMLFTTGGATAAEKTITPTAVRNGQVASASTEIAPPINLVIGKSTILRLPAPAARISVGNPVVADINLINPREAYLLGKEIGSTNLIIWGRDGVATVIDVTVNIDAAALQATMRQLLPEEPGIAVDVAYDSVILKGEVSDAIEADRAVSIADAFVRKFNRSLVSEVTMPGSDKGVSVSLSGGRNAGAAVSAAGARIVNMLRIRAPQQVMLEVKIAEINKTLAEKLGFDFARQYTGGGGAWTKTISGIIGGKPGGGSEIDNVLRSGSTGLSSASGLSNSVTNTTGFSSEGVKGLLNSAATVPANFLDNGILSATVPAGTAIPTNVLLNNSGLANEAISTGSTNSIASALSQMIPGAKDFTSWLIDAQKTDGLVKILAEPNIVAISGQEGRFLVGGEIMIPVTGREGEVTLESKEFGVGLSFTPTVLEEGRINIKVLSAVTDLINLNPATFSARKAATTVQLRDGQSLAIGGLLQDNFSETVKRFPVLGEIPILGTLFRSTDYQKKKTELLIVVTPRLIKPLAPDYILPTDGFVEPSRSELLFEGKMEGRKTRDDQSESKPAAAAQPASGGFEMK